MEKQINNVKNFSKGDVKEVNRLANDFEHKLSGYLPKGTSISISTNVKNERIHSTLYALYEKKFEDKWIHSTLSIKYPNGKSIEAIDIKAYKDDISAKLDIDVNVNADSLVPNGSNKEKELIELLGKKEELRGATGKHKSIAVEVSLPNFVIEDIEHILLPNATFNIPIMDLVTGNRNIRWCKFTTTTHKPTPVTSGVEHEWNFRNDLPKRII